MRRKTNRKYVRDLRLREVFTIIATSDDGKILCMPHGTPGRTEFLVGPDENGDSEIINRVEAVKWLVENALPEPFKQVFTTSFLARLRGLDTPHECARSVVSADAKSLLSEVFVSLDSDEIKAGGKPIPLTALVELIQHHPGLAEEVDAIVMHAQARPTLRRLEQSGMAKANQGQAAVQA